MKKVAVIILNWNTKSYLRSFLPSVIRSCEQNGEAEVVVADNASEDGSMELMKELFPSIATVQLDRNYGFTGGYNRAIAALEKKEEPAEYYILLNSDIEVDGDWIAPLLSWMEAHPECGICGPKLHALLKDDKGYRKSGRFEYAGAAGGLMDGFGFPFCRGRVRKKTAEDKGQYDNPANVLWVTGACLMVRASLWKELGGLDERFFAHMEEIDLCWRAQLAGYKVTVVPESLVWHLGGGTLSQDSPWKLQLNFRNNLLLLEKNLAATWISRGASEKKAQRKSRKLLQFRLFLDNCARIVYFCTGRKKCADAVSKAHAEWKELRNDAPEAKGPVAGAKVEGLAGGFILFKRV